MGNVGNQLQLNVGVDFSTWLDGYRARYNTDKPRCLKYWSHRVFVTSDDLNSLIPAFFSSPVLLWNDINFLSEERLSKLF
jgi:hypothetical protein